VKIRITHRCLGLAAVAAVGSGILHGCAPAVPTSAPAARPVAAVAAAPPEPLDLCRPPNLPPPHLRSKAGYTQFHVMVTNQNGAPVTGLGASDFAVRSGTQSYPAAYFRAENPSDTPVSLVVVGDLSESMYGKILVARPDDLRKARDTIVQAEDQLNECDEVALVTAGGINRNPTLPPLSPVGLTVPFTTSHPAALTRMFWVKPSGPNLLPDAVKVALDTLGRAHYQSRALVVLTDGFDAKAMEECARILKKAPQRDFSFWVIGIGDPDVGAGPFPQQRATGVDANAVRQLAAAGGGRALFARPVETDDGASLAESIKSIVQGLAAGYTIGAVLPPTAAKVSVTLADRQGLSVSQQAVPSKLLTEAAARPAIVEPAECVARAAVPRAISSEPGFTKVSVTVTRADHAAVDGLKESDFKASCAGKPCRVVYFADAAASEPRSIVIAIDTSGSMASKLDTVRTELGRFIEKIGPCDQMALFAFANRAYLLQALTISHRTLEGKLALLHPFGNTALYDTIEQALHMLKKAEYPRRAIVLVTDGVDDDSSTSEDELIADLRKAQVPVYAIGIGNPLSINHPLHTGPLVITRPEAVDPRVLESIASASGGAAFIVPPMDQDSRAGFAAAIANVEARLSGGYLIGVINSPGSSIPDISIANRPDLIVRVGATDSRGK
jgi:Ca-activated chloride channel family protein